MALAPPTPYREARSLFLEPDCPPPPRVLEQCMAGLGSWLPGLPTASGPHPLVLAPAAPLQLPAVTAVTVS